MDEKRISMISDGPQGPSILFTDGSTESVPSEDAEPPPLVGDVTFEETRAGFEVWLSERLVHGYVELIEGFVNWLREQPEVVSVLHDDLEVVIGRRASK